MASENSTPRDKDKHPSEPVDNGPDLQSARAQMVREQLTARGITDTRVISAISRIPREAYIPSFLAQYAYEDHPLLIGYDQTISQPYMVGYMTQSLALKGHERVLEIGSGSGYQTALLAELCKEVFSIERIKLLHERAANTLEEQGYKNVHLHVGDGALGWPDAAPFDAIIVTAGAGFLPGAYLTQVVDEGKIVIPLGPKGKQSLHRLTRHGDEADDEKLMNVSFVPLIVDQPTQE